MKQLPTTPGDALPGRGSRGLGARTAAAFSGALIALACGNEQRAAPLPDGLQRNGQPIVGCEEFSYLPCDILTGECQAELFALMACMRGEESAGVALPKVRLLVEADAAALVEEAAIGMMPALAEGNFASEVRAMEMLGLIAPGLITEGSDVLDAAIESLLAFYLTPTQEIVIIDRGESLTSLDANAVLAHELVHALQDARHGLAQFAGANDLDSDTGLALTAVIEGEATLQQLNMTLAYEGMALGDVDYDLMFDELTRFGGEVAFEAGSPMLTAGAIFPYTYGVRYAGEQWLSGQTRALDALFEDPPESSLEVMLANRAPLVPAWNAFEVAPSAPLNYRLVSEDVAGAWMVFGVMAALAADPGALADLTDLAEQWRGDRIWVYQNDEAEPAVAAVWAIDWAGASVASQFAAWFELWAPGGAVTSIRAEGATTRIVAVERAEDLEPWAGAAASGTE